MLIPSKFNGYQSGIRIYPVGGGVGEAMLLGAAMGGGSAAITGGDPLKGALLGGLTGGIGGGISSGISALNPATTTALTTAGEAATQAGLQGATQAAIPGATSVGTTSALNATSALNPAVATGTAPSGIASLPAAANAAPTSFSAFGEPVMAGSPAATMADPTGLAQAQLDLNAAASRAIPPTGGTFTEGMARFANNPLASLKANPFTAGAAGLAGAMGARPDIEMPGEYDGVLKRFRFNPDTYRPAFAAEGGIMSLAGGGYDRMVGEQPMYQAMAHGGISDLGSYSDGGRMLRGPGDGMSDNIPGVIAGKRPARLADGEFVIPADVVSHLGNGSTDAGARQLYSMMDKVRQARTGRKAQGREINPRKYMPA